MQLCLVFFKKQHLQGEALDNGGNAPQIDYELASFGKRGYKRVAFCFCDSKIREVPQLKRVKRKYALSIVINKRAREHIKGMIRPMMGWVCSLSGMTSNKEAIQAAGLEGKPVSTDLASSAFDGISTILLTGTFENMGARDE